MTDPDTVHDNVPPNLPKLCPELSRLREHQVVKVFVRDVHLPWQRVTDALKLVAIQKVVVACEYQSVGWFTPALAPRHLPVE